MKYLFLILLIYAEAGKAQRIDFSNNGLKVSIKPIVGSKYTTKAFEVEIKNVSSKYCYIQLLRENELYCSFFSLGRKNFYFDIGLVDRQYDDFKIRAKEVLNFYSLKPYDSVRFHVPISQVFSSKNYVAEGDLKASNKFFSLCYLESDEFNPLYLSIGRNLIIDKLEKISFSCIN